MLPVIGTTTVISGLVMSEASATPIVEPAEA
jgi:hypothetical protein